jgi:hypothetical protein
MWRMLKAEFVYSIRLILGLLLFVPLVALQQIRPLLPDLSATYMLFLLILLVLQNWTVFSNKEMRARYHVRLPVSFYELALLRVLRLVLIWILFWGVFALLCFAFAVKIDFKSSLISAGLLMMVFSFYYMMRDHLTPLLREHGFTSKNMMVGLVFVFLGLNALGLLFFLTTSRTGKPPVNLDFIITYARYFKYAGMTEAIKMCLGGLFLAGLSVFSYVVRKSHLD